MKDFKIFVTNDDGIHSPGIYAAVQAVKHLGEIIIAAPSSQQTAMGRSLKGNKNAAFQAVNFEVDGENFEAYECECSPAVIVRHSMAVLFQHKKPDLVVSGINYGENIGATITSSGTVGAALEGATFGIPSIAVSKETDFISHHKYTEQNWTGTQYFLSLFADKMLNHKLPVDVDLLKIDVPDIATSETPWQITRQAKIPYYSTIIEEPSLESKLGDSKVTIDLDVPNIETNTDIYKIYVEKKVSVTPISVDLTSRVDFTELYDVLSEV